MNSDGDSCSYGSGSDSDESGSGAGSSQNSVNDSYGGDDYNEENDDDGGNDGNEDESNQLARDKEWLDSFIQDKLKKQITKVEQEADNIRNKKIRGAAKKQKDMLKVVNDKLKVMRVTREKCEELAMTMEFLEAKAIKNLQSHLKKYYDDHENDALRNNVDKEVTALIELADNNRKKEDLLNSGELEAFNSKNEEQKVQANVSDDAKYGHLAWLDKLIDMSQAENQDIVCSQKIKDVSQLRPGYILDAQDQYFNWHLSIVCQIQPNNP